MYQIPNPINEEIKAYTKGSVERAELEKTIKDLKSKVIEIPLHVAGQEIRTGNMGECRMPHNHKHILGRYHKVTKEWLEISIKAALLARNSWSKFSLEDRAAIFLKAADLLAGKYRSVINAATMLGQSKTVFQAEIDSACEFIDFLRFNAHFAQKIYNDQPISSNGVWNRLEYRPLEGFVFAVTPFNFTSIAGNLPTAPAIMGNTVIWKPASSSVYSAHFIMKILKEAGLPDGVINLIPGSGKEIAEMLLKHPSLAGIHFTGSTEVFREIWKTVGQNINSYKSYPRLVGETGGKDFIFVHESADIDAVATAIIRGGFEYQGQKCSAASRVYIPNSLWPQIREKLIHDTNEIKIGDIEDYTNFMGAVIDKAAFERITSYINYAKESTDAEIIAGGEYDDSIGYLIKPTIILTSDPNFKTMEEEIFGPVVTIYVYNSADFEETLEICDQTSNYALTGSIFAKSRAAITLASQKLINCAGNFYINDKPTGAVVGQQPFGGSRQSGTNDKAGSYINLLRWTSPRCIKETFVPATDYKYPFMEK